MTDYSAITSREAWLQRAVSLLTPMIERETGLEVPTNLRVSVGFGSPKAFSARNPSVGSCWDTKASADGSFELFVSPIQDKPEEVLETVLHELLHAVVGTEAGHRGPFIKAAKAVGFLSPWTTTPASEGLKQTILDLAAELGPYPHASMSIFEMKKKKQTTRMLKVLCAENADDEAGGYTGRVTRKWLKKFGAPICPCHNEPMQIDDPDGLMDEEEENDDE